MSQGATGDGDDPGGGDGRGSSTAGGPGDAPDSRPDPGAEGRRRRTRSRSAEPGVAEQLARRLAAIDPDEAARRLERLRPERAAGLVARWEPSLVGPVMLRLSPGVAAGVLAALPAERAAAVLARHHRDRAAASLRSLGQDAREAVLAALPPAPAEEMRAVLRFPEDTAGACMDPTVLALAEDLDARGALDAVRRRPESARYNVYVVDRERRLVGALTLRELLVAPARSPLSELMHRDPYRLLAAADRYAVVSHPGWREVSALPVVDGDGRYVGAVRYRTFRELEGRLREQPLTSGAETAHALGDLFSTGASGLLEALVSAGRR